MTAEDDTFAGVEITVLAGTRTLNFSPTARNVGRQRTSTLFGLRASWLPPISTARSGARP